MEKFWAVILIFAIVAAGGLLYVNQVYAPQKDAQVAMADTANQTLTAVRMEMDNDDTPSFVKGEEVIQTVKSRCNSGNTVDITVATSKETKVYKYDSDGIDEQVEDPDKMFIKTPDFNDGELVAIEFKEY